MYQSFSSNCFTSVLARYIIQICLDRQCELEKAEREEREDDDEIERHTCALSHHENFEKQLI